VKKGKARLKKRRKIHPSGEIPSVQTTVKREGYHLGQGGTGVTRGYRMGKPYYRQMRLLTGGAEGTEREKTIRESLNEEFRYRSNGCPQKKYKTEPKTIGLGERRTATVTEIRLKT